MTISQTHGIVDDMDSGNYKGTWRASWRISRYARACVRWRNRYSLGDIARALNVSRATVGAWVRSGRLRVSRPRDGVVYVRRIAIERMLATDHRAALTVAKRRG